MLYGIYSSSMKTYFYNNWISGKIGIRHSYRLECVMSLVAPSKRPYKVSKIFRRIIWMVLSKIVSEHLIVDQNELCWEGALCRDYFYQRWCSFFFYPALEFITSVADITPKNLNSWTAFPHIHKTYTFVFQPRCIGNACESNFMSKWNFTKTHETYTQSLLKDIILERTASSSSL